MTQNMPRVLPRLAMLLLGLLLAAAAFSVGPIRIGAVESEESTTRQFWNTFAVAALDIEPAASTEELLANSDAVIVGEILDVQPGRVVGEALEDVPGGQVLFANVNIRVAEVLRGQLATPDQAALTLEVLFPGRRDFKELATLPIPSSEAVFFVRNNATTAAAMGHSEETQERERPYYHLSIQRAVLADKDGVVIAPVWTDHDDFLASYEGRSFEAVVEEFRQR